jgi:hypothetical protein
LSNRIEGDGGQIGDHLNITKKSIAIDRNEIDDIWKTDIFPNWEYHWDYANTKPKSIEKYRKMIE